MLVRVYQRRGTAVEWTTTNPILAEGELALESDTDSFKIGDGETAWNDLDYASGKSAYVIAVQSGFTGTEQEWVDSLNAYGIAVSNGYTGSVNDWLESLSAYGVALDNGFTGTEQEWLDSLTGYAIAVENGFTGTQQEWLDSLTAYGVAVDNGYTGTEQQWLESLTAYGIALENGFTGTEQDWLNTLTAYGLAVTNGYTGTQQEWLESLTAYGIALENGFTGTEQDWLDSLVGPQGDTGPQGAGLIILGALNNESELPASGELGDAYIIQTNLYIWNGTDWENVGGIGTSAFIDVTPPSGAVTPGSLWYDSETGRTYIYLDDGDSSQWVEI